jgi:Permuted papain-like amidase enzyme, YaeF/YiiX, C92 family
VGESLLDRAGRWLSRYLARPSAGYQPYTPSDPETLRAILQPGDVLLIEGNQRISSAIKYLTQSTWSHAAFYVGAGHGSRDGEGVLIEVTIAEGCIAVPLSKYRNYNTRICRPLGLTEADRAAVRDFMLASLGRRYDMRNMIDLARYLLPNPPVPVRWRRRLLALGAGDPTRAICSSLIAEAFGRIGYPILPLIEPADGAATRPTSTYSRAEILHIRHHSLYTPRDFDLSPFFRVVKPTIERGFDYRELRWAEEKDEAEANSEPPTVVPAGPKA